MLLSLTATPSLSQSGSVPITISASIFFASWSANSNASGSSGFGDLTVGKSPSGLAWDATTCTFLYPASSSTSGTDVIEVPWRDVNIIFKFSLLFNLNLPNFTEVLTKALSISSSMISISDSFGLNSILLKCVLFI